MKTDVRVFETRQALNEALSDRLAREIEESQRAPLALMLAGGHTPLQAYQALAARGTKAPAALSIFFSDERYVPVTSDASNFRAIRPLLESLQLPTERVLRVRTELSLERAVEDYEHKLRELLSSSTRISLGLLGLGADGHTASLFTEGDLHRAAGKLAVSVQRPDGRAAVSVTPQVLARVAEVLFVVAGGEKQAALAALVGGLPESIAARAVADCPSVAVWADREAWPRETTQPDSSR